MSLKASKLQKCHFGPKNDSPMTWTG